MTAVAVEITPRKAVADGHPNGTQERHLPTAPEPVGVVIVDVEALASASDRGCGEDNPYQ
ncbi:hypothetical protein ACFYXL_09550 [Streptomyces tsukubensis]|uniref:hypothetical protein n=1 Tax=Streptomyces tsukubensis TaxID=83656 RepID=UPI0036856EF7